MAYSLCSNIFGAHSLNWIDIFLGTCLLVIAFAQTDSSEGNRAKVTVENPHGSVKMRGANQIPVIGPDDDLTGMLLQVRASVT